MVAAGYRDRMPPDPFAGRTFTTSDLGEIHQGRLRILGRADDLINTGGKKVSPLRVEQALRTLTDVEDAIVVGVPDPEWGARTVALGNEALTTVDGATALGSDTESTGPNSLSVGFDAEAHATEASAIGSQSRGALLAIVAMVIMLWLRLRRKMLAGAVIASVAASLLAFMPASWEQRMSTIQTYAAPRAP